MEPSHSDDLVIVPPQAGVPGIKDEEGHGSTEVADVALAAHEVDDDNNNNNKVGTVNNAIISSAVGKRPRDDENDEAGDDAGDGFAGGSIVEGSPDTLEEEDGGEGEETLSSMVLRLAEAKASVRGSTEHHAFALRTAEEEAATLRRFAEMHKRYRTELDLRVQQHHRSLSALGWSEADIVKLGAATSGSAAEASPSRRGLAATPQGAAAVYRLISSTQQLNRDRATVIRLRDLLEGIGARRQQTAAAPSADHLIHSLYSAAGVSWEKAVDLEKMGASSASLHLPAASGTASSLAESESSVLAALEGALPWISCPSRREAVKELGRELSALQQHNRKLTSSKEFMTQTLHEMADTLDALALPAQEWGLMMSQREVGKGIDLACSPTAAKEQAALALNHSLHTRLGDLQSMLAVLTASSCGMPPSRGAAPSDMSTHEQQRQAVQQSVKKKEALRDALISEVLHLRKCIEADERGAAQRHEVLAHAPEPCHRGQLATHRIARRLIEKQYDVLAGVVQKLLHPITNTTGEVSEGGIAEVQRVSKEEEEEEGTADAAPLLPYSQLLSLEESVASRHHALTALLAYNARLSQQLKDAVYVTHVAADASAAKEVAGALLQRCGYDVAPQSEDDDGTGALSERAMTAGPSALASIEDTVLSSYHEHLSQLTSAANDYLQQVHETCVVPERQARLEVAYLISLLYASDQQELSRVCGAEGATASEVHTTALAAVLGELTTKEDADVVTVPSLPPSAENVRQSFAAVSSEQYKAILPEWESWCAVAEKRQTELTWYAQFDINEVAGLLEEGKQLKTTLLRATADASNRVRQVAQDQQLIATTQTQIDGLVAAEPLLVQRITQLKSELELLEAESARRQQQMELEAAGAEAERQLREQEAQEGEGDLTAADAENQDSAPPAVESPGGEALLGQPAPEEEEEEAVIDDAAAAPEVGELEQQQQLEVPSEQMEAAEAIHISDTAATEPEAAGEAVVAQEAPTQTSVDVNVNNNAELGAVLPLPAEAGVPVIESSEVLAADVMAPVVDGSEVLAADATEAEADDNVVGVLDSNPFASGFF